MAENKETAYRTLLAEIKRYLCLKADYYKLTGIEKLSMLLASITIAGIVAILMFVALFYLTSALQTCLGDVVGVPLSYVIVAVIYIILGVLVIVFKKPSRLPSARLSAPRTFLPFGRRFLTAWALRSTCRSCRSLKI